MNVVSFETAKALKEAGFPQDDHMYAWHYIRITSNPELCVSMLGYMAMHYLVPLSFVDDKFLNTPSEETVFAPTATDILREIPSNKSVCMTYIDGEFLVSEFGIGPYEFPEFTEVKHKNPAEAMAIVWLELNKKNK